ncbi:MAG: PAS domain S-box protein [Anaerolineales bacterium]|nr:PAS domain S-box protein [Anaerolineales bacterium]
MKLWSKSLVSRLVISFTLLTLVTISLIGYVAYDRARNALAESVYERLNLASSLKQAEIQRWVDDQRQNVILISGLQDVQIATEILLRYEPQDLEYLEAYTLLSNLLEDSVALKPDWREAFILADESGEILISTDKTHEGDFRIEDRYYTQGRLRTFVQPVYPSPVTLKPTLTIATPIYDANHIRQGILAVHLNLDYLDEVMLQRAGMGESGEAYLVDSLNVFVSSQAFGRDQFPRGVHTVGIDAAVQGQSGQGLYENYAGIPVVGVYSWLDELKLALLVEIQQQEALTPARRLGLTIFLAGVVVSGLIGIIAYLMALQIARPVLAIRDAADKATAGDLDARAAVLTQDEVGGLANAFNHMTEQIQQLYQSLHQSEEYFRSLIEDTSDITLVLNPDSTVRYASPALGRVLGYSPEEWQGKNVFDYLHPEDQSRARRAYYRAQNASDGIIPLELRARHADGNWHVFEALGHSRINDPVIAGFIINARDISERKQMENSLRQSESKYRLVIDHALQGMILIRGDKVQFANPAICKITGYSTDEMSALDMQGLMSLVHPEDLPGVMEVQQMRASGEWKQPAYQFRFHHKDGSWRWVEAFDTLLPNGDEPHILTAILDVHERKVAEIQIRRQIEQLRSLHTIDTAISASHDRSLILNVIIDQVIAQLEVDAAAVLLLNPHSMQLDTVAGRGFRAMQARPPLRVDEGWAGKAIRERRLVRVPSVRETNGNIKQDPFFTQEGFSAYYVTPLIAKGQVKGVLEVFHRANLAMEPERLDFMETLAGQTAIAIDNISMFNDLQRSNLELAMAYDATIEGWSRALDLRDHDTEGHSLRVAEITLRLAKAMDISEGELIHLRWGALLHDIGKMGVPDAILHKPAPLTEEEWEVMRQHPTYAYEMLSPIEFLRQSIDIPYCHHEQWDGLGYPRQLKGEQIPLSARIFAVIDSWDALCNDRPYRKAWLEDEVRRYIQEQAGARFDPRVVDAFLQLLDET